MPLRLSKGFRNFQLEGGSVKQALAEGVIKIYTGTQPASADDAASGTLLATITVGSGAHTNEVRATGSVALTGGASGSVDAITVNSIAILPAAVNFDTSLAVTATKVAKAINDNPKNYLFEASVSGATITLKAKPGLGTLPNGWVVATTVTTITKTDTNFSGGVNAANGLKLSDAANGSIVKDPDQVWSGVAAATGTAGWFRFYGSESDDGSADSLGVKRRLDGTVATSGGNLNMTSTSIAASATQTVNSFTLTEPAS